MHREQRMSIPADPFSVSEIARAPTSLEVTWAPTNPFRASVFIGGSFVTNIPVNPERAQIECENIALRMRALISRYGVDDNALFPHFPEEWGGDND